jgi:hypothetical protein
MSGAGADRGSRGRLALAVGVAAVTTAACLALATLASTASALPFNAHMLLAPVSTASDSPTGLDVTLSIEQTGGVEELAAADLKDSTVTLPVGMTLDPSAANGLEACTEEEFGLHTEAQPNCPAASAVGTVAINTLLLEHTGGPGSPNVTGTIYVGSQESDEPESGKMYRIFLVVNNFQRGILVKLEGSVSANKETGQLTTSFIETPQLPFASLYLHFNSGPNASLATPVTCGSFPASSVLVPWSAPYQPSLEIANSIVIKSGPNGEHCVSQAAERPFAPTSVAGTASPAAGAYSPFTLTFSRNDGEQELLNLSVVMPPGLLASIASVPLCQEPQAAAGTCSSASQVGVATIAAGPGPEPFFLKNQPVYLTGPYKGGPFGLEVVADVIAGPFNLGTVVVRQSLKINPMTSQVTVTSDPFPTIIGGTPVRMRETSVAINRPGFTFNPTDCNPSTIGLTLGSTDGASDSEAQHYQSANCQSLSFSPSFDVSTSAKTSKALGASLTAKVSYPPGAMGTQAWLKSAKVELPKFLPSRLTTLQKACTAKAFEANPASCPAESVIGHAIVHTEVLPVPLEGPAYFVSHGGESFPSLEVVLQGDGVTIDLVGTTFISKSGITSTTFKATPDTPFETFELTLPQGKYSALAANGNLCLQNLVMPTAFVAQNGATLNQHTHIEVKGCSNALSIISHSISKRTLKVSVYVPGAGKVKVSGAGLTSATKGSSRRGAVSFTLRQKKAGKLSTKLKVVFTPSKGKRQSKTLKLKFRK